MSSSLQSALDRLAAASVELRAATEAVLAAVPAGAGVQLLPPDLDTLIPRIVATTAAVYRIEPAALLGRERSQPTALARQMAMSIAVELTGATTIEIGRRFERDHGTVSHAIATVEDRRATEHVTAAAYDAIKARLRCVSS